MSDLDEPNVDLPSVALATDGLSYSKKKNRPKSASRLLGQVFLETSRTTRGRGLQSGMAGRSPENALLRSLSAEDLGRLEPHLDLVPLRTGDVLYEMEDFVEWVYLPELGLLSMITVMASGAAVETSIVGREGGVGFIEALGSETIFSRVIVQVPGRSFRVHARPYRNAFATSASMRKAVHRQVELLQAESRQAIACHALHSVAPRFNRWILECQDIAGGMNVMPLRQEFLAVMLGVSRTTVTRIALDAQERGLIRYVRGSVEILDRTGLERGACECRASVQHLRRELEPRSALGRTSEPGMVGPMQHRDTKPKPVQ